MPFNAIHEYDAAVAANNTDVGGNNIAEGCAPSGINNALRELARQVRAAVANQGSDIASAATTNIGAATGQYARVTGMTAITSLGTVNAGVMRWVEFTGALTLTHNATSLKLPGSANIITAAGDVGLFVSLGSGNWKCLYFCKVDGSAIAAFAGILTSTDAGATEGPDFIADRNSASPAASDVIGGVVLRGRDSAANATDYARLRGIIVDPTNGSEDGQAIISVVTAGAETDIVKMGPGAQIGSPTGGDKGLGTLNAASGLYVDGAGVHAKLLHIQDQKANGTAGGGFTSGSFQTRTLNTKITDEIGSTLSANQFTLPAGTYWAEWSAPASLVDAHTTKLRNITDGSDTIVGQVARSAAAGGTVTMTHSLGRGRFTIAAQKTFELQHRCATTKATDGFGLAASLSVIEVYSDIRVYKVG